MIAALLRLPPVYFAAGLMAMAVLDGVVPGARAELATGWSLAPAAAGVVLIAWATLLFRRAGTPLRPQREATRLVIAGPYRFSRNPIYLGLLLLLVAFWLRLGSLTPGLVLPLFVVLLERNVIAGEEAALAARFGDAYAGYRARVRRWL